MTNLEWLEVGRESREVRTMGGEPARTRRRARPISELRWPGQSLKFAALGLFDAAAIWIGGLIAISIAPNSVSSVTH